MEIDETRIDYNSITGIESYMNNFAPGILVRLFMLTLGALLAAGAFTAFVNGMIWTGLLCGVLSIGGANLAFGIKKRKTLLIRLNNGQAVRYVDGPRQVDQAKSMLVLAKSMHTAG